MIWTIALQLLKNKWFWVFVLVLGMGYFVYHLYSENQQLKLEKATSEQNESAARDELSQTRDSMTVLTSYVEDLNSENKKLKKEIKAWKAEYEVAIDSIRVLNQQASGHMNGDTTGVVTFSGRKNIVEYSGETEINVKTNASKLNYLKLDFDVINAGSELFLDKEDGLWKLRTFTLTKGINVKGVSRIDPDTFRRLRGVPSVTDERANIFGIGAIFGKNMFAPGIQIRPSTWEIGAHYIIIDGTKQLENWQDKVLISVHFFPF